ncbi:hypothetical protein ACFQ0M_49240 [Kitasatospora aburaviensis]
MAELLASGRLETIVSKPFDSRPAPLDEATQLLRKPRGGDR